MKIIAGEGINEYYAQTLAMLFFPGAKFPKQHEEDDDPSELEVSCTEDAEGNLLAFARMKREDGKEACGEGTFVPMAGVTPQRAKKLAVGRAVFAAGKELFGVQPPWGVLTGVRPAKVAAEFLASGGGIQKTRQFMRSEYFLSQKKAALCASVAAADMKLKKQLAPNMCSVYISIPFCPSRCAYCSFVSYTTPRLLSMIDEYLDRLIEEIGAIFRHIARTEQRVACIYVGGGTPTILSPEQMKRLLSAVSEYVNADELLEFTVEAGRPDTITEEKLAVCKQYGVTRISVNPQSLSDAVLENIGRKHTSMDFFRAYGIAKESGIRDINVDLIAGLPGDNFTRFSRTLDRVCELEPSNITVHSFCVKKSSDFLRQSTDIYKNSGGDAVKCVDYSQLKLRNTGYKPYYLYRQKNTVGNLENVGFAREGHEGLYNVIMMEEFHSVYGAGAGAVTRLVSWKPDGVKPEKIKRIINPKYPYEYLRDDFSASAFEEKLFEAEEAFKLDDKNAEAENE
ncbi:MAG: coproporphyrinogen dehydrogenase HemZ [Clostridia bacterium]|nr:coproporphyrinogen dehydrogenase HemZ [Clostridia bacterium]MBQ1933991.1 coproporphyrinogen dehydrogenase HemZ [Clostridia bacterium]MBQ5808219.1 coproporphyrinogen dehydrogenase HemZ [Clostridia bacterium]